VPGAMAERAARVQARADGHERDDCLETRSPRSAASSTGPLASFGSTASSVGPLASFGSAGSVAGSVGSLNFLPGGYHGTQHAGPGFLCEPQHSRRALPVASQAERGPGTAPGHITAQEAHVSAQEADGRFWVGPMLQGGASGQGMRDSMRAHGSRQRHEPYAREHRPGHPVQARLGNMLGNHASNFDNSKLLHHVECPPTAAHAGAVELPSDSQGRRDRRRHPPTEAECDDSDLTLGPGAPPGF